MVSSERAFASGAVAGLGYLAVATAAQVTVGAAPLPTLRLALPWALLLLAVAGVVGALAGGLLALSTALWRRAERLTARLLLGVVAWLFVSALLAIASRETVGISYLLERALYGALALPVVVLSLALPARARVERMTTTTRRALAGPLALLCALPLFTHLRFPDLYAHSHFNGAVVAAATGGVALLLSNAPLPRGRVMAGALALLVVGGVVVAAAAPFGLSSRVHLLPPVHGALAGLSSFAPDADGDGYRAGWGLAPLADCDDDDPATRPAAVDVPGDGRDQNCFAGDVDPNSRVLAEVCGDRRARCDAGGDVADEPPRNIVFLTLDALNFMDGHRGGLDPRLTPFLASLLDESLYAEAYRSCASSTTTSTDLNWSGADLALPKGEHKSFVSLLARERGYRTYELSAPLMPAARVGHEWDVWGGRGARGFQYDDDRPLRDRALAVLAEAEAPFFLHLHALSLHRPRPPVPPCSRSDSEEALYDCQLMQLDGYVRDIVEALWRHHGKERSLVVIHGDHGENLVHEHATSLREEIVHTPLLFVDGRPGRAVTGPAGCRDILPTTFDLAGVCDARVTGRSLARWQPPPERAQLMLIGYPTPSPRSLLRYGLRQARDKLVLDFATGGLTAWDVVDDPDEERGALVYDHRLVGELDAWMALHRAALVGEEICPPAR